MYKVQQIALIVASRVEAGHQIGKTMSDSFKNYLKAIEDALKKGNATEHTHRSALKTLLEALDLQITATNEPKRIACGAPDFIITRNDLSIGYIEAKDVGKSLKEAERTDQLKRYRRALENLVLTDYLNFFWYVDGELREKARLAHLQSNGKLKPEKDGVKSVEQLLQNFLAHQAQAVSTPKDLAQRMARLTHIIRDIIVTAFETGQESDLLQGWRDAFAKVLIADLGQPERTADFADMVSQTLAYGLFSARLMDTTPGNFSRDKAQRLIPKSNPFLRRFFAKITSIELDDEPFAPFFDDLLILLMHTDMEAVLADFGKRTRQEDPVVHFYETFLSAYDPNLRETRGVYYTPEPVVSYIVRSVDHLLKVHFKCPQGLADDTKITIPNYDPSLRVKGKKKARKTTESHKVLVRDPAAGTGTFLYSVIDQIRQRFIEQGNAGMWAGYVKNHLLPRLFGFELLVAPYAVAHFKLSLQLAGRDLPEDLRDQWEYHPGNGERLGVYLTNTLEEAHEMTGLPLFTQWVADETNAANEVKRHLPVLVVMGNPPYSGHSANKGKWIDGLLNSKSSNGTNTGSYYEVDGKPLGERNPKWLQNDYVKFIRFAQWRIEQTGHGILAFITDHSYLNSPTFRGMRQQLMRSFSEIYLLNLHGNSTVKEIPPDSVVDENVFDIQQGVAIGIFVKRPKGSKNGTSVQYADLWGKRTKKYDTLLKSDLSSTQWKALKPESPFYFFVPKQFEFQGEYQNNWQITDIFPRNSMGIATARDKLAVQYSPEDVWQAIVDFSTLSVEDARVKYGLGKDARDWKVDFAQADIMESGPNRGFITPISYRPFDVRFTYYTGRTRGFICMPRSEVMTNLANKENLALCFIRRSREHLTSNYFVATNIVDKTILSSADNAVVAPLYLYPAEDSRRQKSLLDVSHWQPDESRDGRVPNLNPHFVADMEKRLGLTFVSDSKGDLKTTFGPEEIFSYVYAIFYSPTYRERYAELLKVDFSRIPLTSDVDLFCSLCELGRNLIDLHLLRSVGQEQGLTRYPVVGNNEVEKGYPEYIPPTNGIPGRVNINKTQYFEGIAPETWSFYIGGYQVLHKWFKDRRGRQLSYDDLAHYQRIILAIHKTIELMRKIDNVIPGWPIQ